MFLGDASAPSVDGFERYRFSDYFKRIPHLSAKIWLEGNLVRHFRDWYSIAAAYFGGMCEAKRENTRCGL
jgi:hypothetical protein